MLPVRDYYKDKHRLKVKGWKMIFQANGIHRKVGVAVLISNEIHFEIKVRDNDDYFIMIKGQLIKKK